LDINALVLKHLVVIPTYNEKENIESIIGAVLQHDEFDVLVVDDGSPDGTADLVRSAQRTTPNRIHLLERKGKLGLGTAYIAGFKYGLREGYDYLYEMDADFSHDPKDLLRLRDACVNQGADMSVGSRYAKGGGFVNWPKNRIFISKGGSYYVQLLTFMPVKDPTAGFICYSAGVLKSFDLDKVQMAGYAFQIEMKYVAWSLGFKIQEVPIIFKDRELGTSKMNIGIIKEAITGVIKLRLRNIKKYYSATV
jgi:dolichol-phosphate mannosyltransferase